MKNTTLAGIVAGTIAGGLLAVNVLDAAAPDVRSVIQTARLSIAASLPIHCEIPCGIYDDHAEVARMRLDAATMKKASAQIVALSKDIPVSSNGANLNTIARWAMIKEEHGRVLPDATGEGARSRLGRRRAGEVSRAAGGVPSDLRRGDEGGPEPRSRHHRRIAGRDRRDRAVVSGGQGCGSGHHFG